MIASIPSPSFNSIDIGPLSINLYGLCIALGVQHDTVPTVRVTVVADVCADFGLR